MSQAFVGIVINPKSAEFKIADAISMAFSTAYMDQDHLQQLYQLLHMALAWVSNRREELHQMIVQEYEKMHHSDLLKLPDVQYTVPKVETVKDRRQF